MARTILVVGAGKSTSYLLDYLLEKSAEEQMRDDTKYEVDNTDFDEVINILFENPKDPSESQMNTIVHGINNLESLIHYVVNKKNDFEQRHKIQ